MTEWVVFGTGSPSSPNETDGPIAVSTGFTINDPGSYWCIGVEFFASTVPPTGVSVALWERSVDESPSGLGALLAFEPAAVAITGGIRNRILFDTPVPVSAALFPNGLYATMRTGNNYVASGGFFVPGPQVSGPITAYQNNAGVGFNGRFKVAPTPTDASNGYPNQTFGGGGYWVSPIITDVDPGGDETVTDGGPRGTRAGGSPAFVAVDTSATDGGPRGLRAGGSDALVEAGTADVVVLDRPGGASAGGSTATVVVATPALGDDSVWPMLVRALACLDEAADQVAEPPLYRSLRTGTDIQASVSPTEDECCNGLAWVRWVGTSPTSAFPAPESAWQPCPPGELSVEIELGMLRCAPTMAPGSTTEQFHVVTSAQWAELTYKIMADQAAMRRAACCLIALGYSIVIGTGSPLATEANCAGSTLRLTVSVPFCERTC